MKRSYLIGGLLILTFGLLGASKLRSTLVTYVGFSEARAAGTRVQIKGKIDKASVHIDRTTKSLVFDVTDDNKGRMTIIYNRPAPGNFSQASHVVAVGKYKDGTFLADELLVKCPSKYQGLVYPPSK